MAAQFLQRCRWALPENWLSRLQLAKRSMEFLRQDQPLAECTKRLREATAAAGSGGERATLQALYHEHDSLRRLRPGVAGPAALLAMPTGRLLQASSAAGGGWSVGDTQLLVVAYTLLQIGNNIMLSPPTSASLQRRLPAPALARAQAHLSPPTTASGSSCAPPGPPVCQAHRQQQMEATAATRVTCCTATATH
mgnify:CR=1 FL=1